MTDVTHEQAQRWLSEHQWDTCEHEMGSRCVGGCPRAFCISDRHRGDSAPEWPCNVARRALGVKSAKVYWDAEDEAWMAWYVETCESNANDAGVVSGA